MQKPYSSLKTKIAKRFPIPTFTSMKNSVNKLKSNGLPKHNNYLLVSHGNRISFFLQEYFSPNYKKHIGNGAVLRINVGRKNSTVEMLFPGYSPTTKFFRLETFPTTTVPTDKITSSYVYKTTNIYIVRHGIAEHNTTKDPRVLFHRDTHLVLKGKSELRRSIPYLPITFDAVFCSSLVRTRQTIQVLLQKFPNRTIHVVPSADEILFRYVPFLNAPPNVPDPKNAKTPGKYKVDWNTIPKGKNMIDEILHLTSNKKVDIE